MQYILNLHILTSKEAALVSWSKLNHWPKGSRRAWKLTAIKHIYYRCAPIIGTKRFTSLNLRYILPSTGILNTRSGQRLIDLRSHRVELLNQHSDSPRQARNSIEQALGIQTEVRCTHHVGTRLARMKSTYLLLPTTSARLGPRRVTTGGATTEKSVKEVYRIPRETLPRSPSCTASPS